MPRPRKVQPVDNVENDVPQSPAPIAPPPPSPAVIALQSSIVDLIERRAAIRQSISAAQSQLFEAQARVQSANGELMQLESEVQYRMSVIAQMENRAPQASVIPWPGTYDSSQPQSMGMSFSGISSEPTQQMISSQVRAGDPNNMVNHGTATRAML